MGVDKKLNKEEDGGFVESFSNFSHFKEKHDFKPSILCKWENSAINQPFSNALSLLIHGLIIVDRLIDRLLGRKLTLRSIDRSPRES